MPDLFFPQLSSGTSAQYPLARTRFIRTIQNAMADGSFYALTDTGAGRMQWQFSFVDLSFADVTALQEFFDQCAGPVQPFTFIDPTANMLLQSVDFTQSAWAQAPVQGLITLQAGASDPFGGVGAFTASTSNAAQLTQQLTVPANYQYCFSIYAKSTSPLLTLTRSGLSLSETIACPVGPEWTRLVCSGQMSDTSTQLSVGIALTPGQTVTLYGPQLEAQMAPSRYRATTSLSGVCSNAHWAIEELPIVAEAPNLYSVSFTIEAAV